jgi:hypothetical protein
MNDREHEKTIRNLYKFHKQDQFDLIYLRIGALIALVLAVLFVTAALSSIVTLLR